MNVKTQLLQKDIEAYFEAERTLQDGRYGLTPENLTAALVVFHKAATEAAVNPKLYQILATEFTQAIRAAKSKTHDTRGPVANGISLRAACIAGIIDGDQDAVGELQPWEVVQLTEKLSQAITAAYDVPKK